MEILCKVNLDFSGCANSVTAIDMKRLMAVFLLAKNRHTLRTIKMRDIVLSLGMDEKEENSESVMDSLIKLSYCKIGTEIKVVTEKGINEIKVNACLIGDLSFIKTNGKWDYVEIQFGSETEDVIFTETYDTQDGNAILNKIAFSIGVFLTKRFLCKNQEFKGNEE